MSDNKGIWLPEAVLELTDLSPTEKVLFAAILPMTFTEPCWAGNEYLAKRIGVSEQTITNNLKTLHDKGYIRIFLDRTGGTTRKMHTYILEDTLYKYVGHPISKFDIPIYKDFIEGLSKSYIGCIKSLCTLYKDFIFTYKDDSKEDKKEESKEQQPASSGDAVVAALDNTIFEFVRNEIEKVRIMILDADILKSQTCDTLDIDTAHYDLLANAFFNEQIALAQAGEPIKYKGLRTHFRNWISVQIGMGEGSKYHQNFKPANPTTPSYGSRNGQSTHSVTSRLKTAIPD